MAQRTEKSAERVVVRPSAKLVRPFYWLAFILIAVAYGYNNNRAEPISPNWLVIPPLLLLAGVAYFHVRLRFHRLIIAGNTLRYETGMLSRTTRTMELSKVQDVRVEQTMMQRVLGVGNLTIQSAGETGSIAIDSIDRPQTVADYILESARR